ncbi:hypothetical protein ACFPOD_13470 [Nitratireductor kimnyeongensis]|uniref:Uncharacterized protein n=1 Tax=Nitratireductor kimnyeongensis TaxID=430679 RepID=A0ABW0TA28_9HYPH
MTSAQPSSKSRSSGLERVFLALLFVPRFRDTFFRFKNARDPGGNAALRCRERTT